MTESRQDQQPNQQKNAFRDSIATVDEQGKRKWIYPKKPKGKFHNRRVLFSAFLLLLLMTGPFIRINGAPALLLNVLERKFVVLGNTFWPQDFYLFVIAMLIFVVVIALFTVIFGRVFCGWVCPQTVFMEMLFRKIEYWVEGDRNQQKALDRTKGTRDYFIKKGFKHLIFLVLSFLISNTFLAYIIGSEALIEIVTDAPANHIGGLVAIFIFTLVFYGVFSKFREQVCTVVCPYGRLQGALLGKDSIVIAYDYVRGETKSKYRKGEDRLAAGKGDCIDCHQCVDVCPTGIDIRNGTQLECVNCTACIDACDAVMDKVGMEKGLIRYASEQSIAEGKSFSLNTRMRAYIGVLVVLLVAMTVLLIYRTEVDTTILRTPGLMYQSDRQDTISNLYNYKIINKTEKPMALEMKLLNKKGLIQLVGHQLEVGPNALIEGVAFVHLPSQELEGMKTNLEIGIFHEMQQVDRTDVNFLGPVQ